jgi:hypothetical protein
VTVDKQYFEMVSAAAFSIERILAQRLSNMAPVDASAVAAELAKAIEEARKQEEDRKAKLASKPSDGAKSLEMRLFLEGFGTNPNQATVQLDLDVLRPKLDECVIRAKL